MTPTRGRDLLSDESPFFVRDTAGVRLALRAPELTTVNSS